MSSASISSNFVSKAKNIQILNTSRFTLYGDQTFRGRIYKIKLEIKLLLGVGNGMTINLVGATCLFWKRVCIKTLIKIAIRLPIGKYNLILLAILGKIKVKTFVWYWIPTILRACLERDCLYWG